MQQEDTSYDVLIIGAGVAGCCIAHELSRYELSCAVLEAGNDVAFATSRANSGIVHAGYDPHPGTLKARYCAEGARMFPRLAEELGFAYLQTGSLVLAFDQEEHAALLRLQEQAAENSVEVALLDASQVREKEPLVAEDVMAALYAPGGGICDPYGLTFAAAEHAAEQGIRFLFEQRVVALKSISSSPKKSTAELDNSASAEPASHQFEVTTASGKRYRSRLLVNAAGVYADEINNQLSSQQLMITPVRGEYLLYDTPYGTTFSHVMFQAPSTVGKGPLITPTVHGNLIVGPNAVAQESKASVATTAAGLEEVLQKARRTWPEASTRGVITNFAGLRAKGSDGDFVIGEASDVPGFYNVACFESPGLTAAPAVAVDLATQIAHALELPLRVHYQPRRKRGNRKLFALMDDAERARAIAEDQDAGEILCRCCSVSKADVVFELKGALPVLCMDALKWRTNAMMGRCNGGFCSPEIMDIIYKQLDRVPEKLDKRLPCSPYVAQSSPSYTSLIGTWTHPAACDVQPQLLGQNQTPEPIDEVYDVVVVGAGAAGMAAALAAHEEGAHRIALLDRADYYGGILRQCIHNGFGLTRFRKELTGPEYASREETKLPGTNIEVFLSTTALSIAPDADDLGLSVVTATDAKGLLSLKARSLVLATGSRERGQGALNVSGSRPAGVYSAGSAQDLINLRGCLPGKKVLIQGSGDIGLIMARRCLFSGAEVLGVFARSSEPSGLRRNVRQCLDDFGIPFYGNKLVTRLEGEARLEAVWISQVDPATKQTIEGSEERWECDTLLLSIGLIPENELALTAGVKLSGEASGPVVDAWLETSVKGIFSCGNSLHIHDLADFASAEGGQAGRSAARHALGLPKEDESCRREHSASWAYTDDKSPEPAAGSPAGLTSQESTSDSARETVGLESPAEPDLLLTCVRCPKGCELEVFLEEDGSIAQIIGEGCKRGLAYATEEITAPTRIVTASLPLKGSLEPISVKTAKAVDKRLIFEVLREANALELQAPLEAGTVLIEDVAGTGAALLATKDVAAAAYSDELTK